MKKLMIVFAAISTAVIAAYFISGKKDENLLESYTRVLPSIDLKKKTARIKDLNLTSKTIPSVKKNISEIRKCLKDQTCGSKKDPRFYDQKLDPVFSQLKDQLEVLSITKRGYEELSTEQLFEILKFKEKATFALSLELLMKKNPENIQLLKEMDFDGEEIRLLKHVLAAPQQEELRREIVKESFEKDNYSFLLTLKNLNHFDLSLEEVRDYQEHACQRIDGIQRFKSTYLKQINKIARKYQLDPNC